MIATTDRVDCPHCGGTGNEPGITDETGSAVPCEVCDGAGWIFEGESPVEREYDTPPDLDPSQLGTDWTEYSAEEDTWES
jgi:hypothetical protein